MSETGDGLDHLRIPFDKIKFGKKLEVEGYGTVFEGECDGAAKATKESDVYAFGVLLLEVLCGVSELVDTDDYQERHVTELVPKKMQQNKLQKIVHRDIRREIKPEALETYAKIACRCLMDEPPQMAQGGEVTYVQIPGSINITSVNDIDIDSKDVTLESYIHDDEHQLPTTDQDDVKDLVAGDKLDDAGDEVSKVSESSNGEKNTSTESVPNKTHAEDASNESSCSNNDLATKQEILTDLNSKKESNNSIENEEDTKSKIPVEDAHKEISTIDSETPGETKDDNASNKKSEEKNEDDQSMEIATTSESSNGDTNTSTNQEVQDSGILKSDREYFNEVNEDELEHLLIPLEKIKFGQKIDGHGYGTMFEGEYDHQQVALKRLNIMNLGNIKPKLLSAILTVSRLRQHPNLVAFIGFCDENNKEMILVYEHVPGGNLADKMSKHLNIIQRLEICLGAARGLEYLHDSFESVASKPGIIHGHLKLSKILLNSDSTSSKFEAKVSGFGFPKLLPGHVEITPKSTDPFLMQGGKMSDVQIFGSNNGNSLSEVPIGEDDHEGEGNGNSKKMSSNITGEESMITEETTDDTDLVNSNDVESVPEDSEKESVNNINDSESTKVITNDLKLNEDIKITGGTEITNESEITTLPSKSDNGDNSNSDMEDAEKNDGNVPDKEEIVVDLKSNEKSKINGENEVNNESKITTLSPNPVMQEHGFPLPEERRDTKDAIKEKGNELMMNTHNPHIEEIMEEQNSVIVDGDKKDGLLNSEKHELTVTMRGDFSNSATQSQEPESKRNNSTHSDSSNGNDPTPSDYLLPKSPDNLVSQDYVFRNPDVLMTLGLFLMESMLLPEKNTNLLKKLQLLYLFLLEIHLRQVRSRSLSHLIQRRNGAIKGLFCTEGNSGITWSHALPGSQADVIPKKIKVYAIGRAP
ncbi:hypothetical protein E3N88_26301 [Mikania micrantha]|uniref:Protein kinase domain-containing protein n=1 Tax=Mikania micrantha TaxID=192012 RepID=A0A5N6N884_9ASTR|nr:hypothetical protein E3N88_26301 [Mikania micrantha]